MEYLAKDYPGIAEQFERLDEVVEKLAAEEETKGNMDAVLFWNGYSAAINDFRYNGLILTADGLERQLNRHFG